MNEDLDNVSDCRTTKSIGESRGNLLAVSIISKKNRTRG
jgi:hypothetical protein